MTLPAECAQVESTVTCTYVEVGVQRLFPVPAGVTSVKVTAVGGRGGRAGVVLGGSGALLAGTLTVTPGSSLYVTVGSAAAAGGSCLSGVQCLGGANGGGTGHAGGGGGGSSDIRTTATSLASRVVVAAGGGGAGATPPSRTPRAVAEETPTGPGRTAPAWERVPAARQGPPTAAGPEAHRTAWTDGCWTAATVRARTTARAPAVADSSGAAAVGSATGRARRPPAEAAAVRRAFLAGSPSVSPRRPRVPSSSPTAYRTPRPPRSRSPPPRRPRPPDRTAPR